jgi:hypothetical protein
MTEREIIELTRKMRLAQQAYFRFRTPTSLGEAKQLEKELDDALAEYFIPTLNPKENS